MTTRITKTWFDGEKLVTQEIAEPEVYKQEPVAWEDVLGAIARGWAHPENARKPMDVQLAVAIAKEIQDMYTTPPAAAQPLGYAHWEERIKDLMKQVGMPNSVSLAGAMNQLVNEMMQATPPAAAAELRRLEAEVERKSAGIKFLWQECDNQERINAQLLEALRDMVNTMTDGPDESDIARVFSVARAAIAAAKGEA